MFESELGAGVAGCAWDHDFKNQNPSAILFPSKA
jgi:hypothetical protein